MISRRFFIAGAAAVAAPAIIRPGVLMPVKRVLLPDGIALASITHPGFLGITKMMAPNNFEMGYIHETSARLAILGDQIFGVVTSHLPGSSFHIGDMVSLK